MPELTLLNADFHVSEPLNLWKERLPAKFRDQAPQMVTHSQGEPGAWWIIEKDRCPANVILGFSVGKKTEELGEFFKSFSRGPRLDRSPFPTKLTMKPSDYFHRQLYTTFIDNPFGIAHRHEIGVDNLLWSSDFPHSASVWPNSQEKTDQDFQGVSEEERRRIS